jgi:hypothetical protein
MVARLEGQRESLGRLIEVSKANETYFISVFRLAVQLQLNDVNILYISWPIHSSDLHSNRH